MHRHFGRIRTCAGAVMVLAVLMWNALPAHAEPEKTEKPLTMGGADNNADTNKDVTPKAATAMQESYSEKSPGAASTKAEYIVISPHTAAECVATLDQVEQEGSLPKWGWGCKQGDHTGYAVVQATSTEEALKMVPANVRAKARAVKLDHFTVAEVKAMHASKPH